MLSHIRTSNDLVLNFDDSRLHAFVGQNNSGKTFALKYIQDNLGASYHSLEESTLRCLDKTLDNAVSYDLIAPVIQSNGYNLPLVLHCMSKQEQDVFKYLKKYLTRVLPNVESIQIHFCVYPDHSTIQILFDTATHSNVYSLHINKGAIFVLGVLTILLNFHQPRLVLIDDIEQGLHPVAQRKLMAVIKEIIQIDPGLQVVLSTHSPYVVDELTPSQVHVFSNRVAFGGILGCKRLDEHPDTEWAKQTLTTGEFWDSVGEDWVSQA